MDNAVKFIEEYYPTLVGIERLNMIDAYMSGLIDGYKQGSENAIEVVRGGR